MNHSGFMCLVAAIFSGNRRDDIVRGRFGRGTLIHNGIFSQPFPIGFLTVPLIKPSFYSLTVTTVCIATLLPPRFTAATVTAILMTAITATAYPKNRAAFAPPTNPLMENNFSRVSHSHPKARLDISYRSWQFSFGCVDNLSIERCCQWTPVVDIRSGSPLLYLPQ